jgi:hypothetical protein
VCVSPTRVGLRAGKHPFFKGIREICDLLPAECAFIAFNCSQEVPMLLMLSVHPSRWRICSPTT